MVTGFLFYLPARVINLHFQGKDQGLVCRPRYCSETVYDTYFAEGILIPRRQPTIPTGFAYPVKLNILSAIQLLMSFVYFLFRKVMDCPPCTNRFMDWLLSEKEPGEDPHLRPPPMRDKIYRQSFFDRDYVMSSCLVRLSILLLCFGILLEREPVQRPWFHDRCNEIDNLLHLRSDASQFGFTMMPWADTSSMSRDDLDKLQASLSTIDEPLPKGEKDVVVDTGASCLASPDKSDFVGKITPIRPGLKHMQGIGGGIPVLGVGTIRFHVCDDHGHHRVIEGEGCYMPDLPCRLLSPQKYFVQQDGGRLIVVQDKTTLEWKDGGIITVKYDPDNCLPVLRAYAEDKIPAMIGQMYMCVTSPTNKNLTSGQKELLKWHYRLGHMGFQKMQLLARRGILPERLARVKLEINSDKNKVTRVDIPKCSACLYAQQVPTSTGRVTRKDYPSKDGGKSSLKHGDLQPGLTISVDQYESRVRGRTWTSRGKTAASAMYVGGTIFCDNASGLIHVEPQVSLNGTETIKAVRRFERWASERGVIIRGYHGDNGVFTCKEFEEFLAANKRTITLCGVGAHHQNGVAERAIRTVVWKARVMMLHASMHWPKTAVAELWPMAMEHAAYLHNITPRSEWVTKVASDSDDERETAITPMDIFTGSHESMRDRLPLLRRQHVWGCPAYVLDPTLRDGGKLPKWQPRSRRGKYLGVSRRHASSVGQILNLKTGYISAQFHVVYDNFFETISAAYDEKTPPCWGRLVANEKDNFVIDLDLEGDAPVKEGRPLELANEWLTDVEVGQRELAEKQRRLETAAQRLDSATDKLYDSADKQRLPQRRGRSNADMVRGLGSDFDLEHDQEDDKDLPAHRTFAPDASWKDAATEDQMRTGSSSNDDVGDDTPSFQPDSPPHGVRRSKRAKIKPQKLHYIKRGDPVSMAIAIASQNDDADIEDDEFQRESLIQPFERINVDPDNSQVDETHWLAYVMQKQSDEDTPRYNEAMRGPYRDGFVDAMESEVDALEKKQTWRLVPRSFVSQGKKVLKSVWAFKIKRFPDGTMRKLKARFCVRGDMQVAGVDYFDTYAPVAQWSTIRMMLILSLVMDLKTKQVDYSNAFAQAPLKDDEEVYIDLPQGFSAKRPGDYVLKLRSSLYGLAVSPQRWFNMLSDGLQRHGLLPSEHDPCLFLGDHVICVVYVDDCLFFAKEDKYIDEIVQKLRKDGFELNYENTSVTGFLGQDMAVTGKGSNKKIKFTQDKLIERLLALTGMTDCAGKDTPAQLQALGADLDGPPRQEAHLWNYAAAVGMLQYLAQNSRPDIALAVNQVSRFTHCPKLAHEQAVKRICRYLKATKNQGLTFTPTSVLDMDCYVDADFAGLWNIEDSEDPSCVKSRTGYFITLAGCPMIWGSKLQQMIALSTTEAEYLALSYAMRQFLPAKALVESVLAHIDKKFEGAIIKSTAFEDNQSCIATAKSKKISPRTKHIATHVHFFRSHIHDENDNPDGDIRIEYIDTKVQPADMLTKSLGFEQFAKLRKIAFGW